MTAADDTQSGVRKAATGSGWPVLRGKRLGLLALLTALVVVVAVAAITTGDRGRHLVGWNLLFSEDFDASSLDPGRWNAQDLPSPRNNELQYYAPKNIEVDRSQLRLTAERERFRGRDYSSAAVDTHNKFSFTYGRVEIRARLPVMGQGIWPALWMLGNGCNPVGDPCPWPTQDANEIDILESTNAPTMLYNDSHHGTQMGQSLSPGPCQRDVEDMSQDFHTFALEWEAGGVLRWYLDGEQVCKRQIPGYFETPMYLFLNVAVGGDLPGPVADDTAFPQQFAIDHVRVYQRT
ncbi:MAG TPA: glycoside hydrolase family 16 protein [Propionibacteriaceae bacterium]|jgi:beta-glucanase (GH16 family)